VSYLNGREVPYGTPGSTRPDFVLRNGTAAYEVKNYDIANNSYGLIRDVSRQAVERAQHLPPGMRQEIIIDVRGQTVSPAQEVAIRLGIQAAQIQFMRK
jgi:filamentous hemagglutinin